MSAYSDAEWNEEVRELQAEIASLRAALERTLPILDHAAIGHPIIRAAQETAQEIRRALAKEAGK